MNDDQFFHICVGITISLVSFFSLFFTDANPTFHRLLWAILFFGFFWSLAIGHGIYYLSLPIGFFAYFLLSPIKLKNGVAVEDTAVVLAYSVLPDRIVLVREFSSIDSLEGRSYFLPRRVMVLTQRILEQSSAKEIEINETLAATVLGAELPRLEDVKPELVDRSYVDYLHKTVTKLWRDNKRTELRGSVLHLAGWYALAADRYWRIDQRSRFEHAVLRS